MPSASTLFFIERLHVAVFVGGGWCVTLYDSDVVGGSGRTDMWLEIRLPQMGELQDCSHFFPCVR